MFSLEEYSVQCRLSEYIHKCALFVFINIVVLRNKFLFYILRCKKNLFLITIFFFPYETKRNFF